MSDYEELINEGVSIVELLHGNTGNVGEIGELLGLAADHIQYGSPIRLDEHLPPLRLPVILLGDSCNMVHAMRAETDKVRWFYVDTGDMILDVDGWYTHWIPCPHPDKWKQKG